MRKEGGRIGSTKRRGVWMVRGEGEEEEVRRDWVMGGG